MSEFSPDFATAWERFQSATSVRLLQETLEWEWTRGRAEFAAFLIPVSDAGAKARCARAVAAIRDIPGVDPYPEDYWHITVKQVGFLNPSPSRPDEVSQADLEALAQEARGVLETQTRFQARIGAPNGFPEVVFLEVGDGGAVRTLNTLLCDRLEMLPRYPIDGAMWLPHVSIARFSSNEGLAALKERLATLRSEDPGDTSFDVNEVLLIQAHLAAEAPTFDMLARYELRG